MTGVTMAEAGPQAGASNGALGDTWWWTEIPLDVCGKGEGLTEEDRTVWVDFKCRDGGGNKAKTTVAIEWKLCVVGETVPKNGKAAHLIQQGEKMIITGPQDTCTIGGQGSDSVYVQVYSAHDDEIIVYEPYDAAHPDEANVVYTFEDEGPDQIFQAGFACQDVKTGEPIPDPHKTTSIHVIKKLEVEVITGQDSDSFPTSSTEWSGLLWNMVWVRWYGSCNMDYLLVEVPRSDAYSSWVDEYQLVGGRKADVPWYVKPFLDADVARWSTRQEPGWNKHSVRATYDGCVLAHDSFVDWTVHATFTPAADPRYTYLAADDYLRAWFTGDRVFSKMCYYVYLNTGYHEGANDAKGALRPDYLHPGIRWDDPDLRTGVLDIDVGKDQAHMTLRSGGWENLHDPTKVRIYFKVHANDDSYREMVPCHRPQDMVAVTGSTEMLLKFEGIQPGLQPLVFYATNRGHLFYLWPGMEMLYLRVYKPTLSTRGAKDLCNELLNRLHSVVKTELYFDPKDSALFKGGAKGEDAQARALQWAFHEIEVQKLKVILLKDLPREVIRGLVEIGLAYGAGYLSKALGKVVKSLGSVSELVEVLGTLEQLKVIGYSTRDYDRGALGVDCSVMMDACWDSPSGPTAGKFVMTLRGRIAAEPGGGPLVEGKFINQEKGVGALDFTFVISGMFTRERPNWFAQGPWTFYLGDNKDIVLGELTAKEKAKVEAFLKAVTKKCQTRSVGKQE